MSPEPIPLDLDNLIRRYAAGESAQDLARVFGVSGGTVLRRLRAAGVEVRQGPSYRTTDTMATRMARAQTRERLRLHAGPHEYEFVQLLDNVGLGYVQQRAFGPYNVDVALVVSPIAVEIVSGGGNRRTKAMRRERIEYLLERGWHVVEVFYRNGRSVYPFSPRAAEYLVALADRVGPTPPRRGKHWMIRGDGQPVASRGGQVD